MHQRFDQLLSFYLTCSQVEKHQGHRKRKPKECQNYSELNEAHFAKWVFIVLFANLCFIIYYSFSDLEVKLCTESIPTPSIASKKEQTLHRANLNTKSERYNKTLKRTRAQRPDTCFPGPSMDK